MNTNHSNAANIRGVLEKLPGVVSVHGIEIKDSMAERFSLEKGEVGRLSVERLDVEDAPALFDFYFQGLSEESRNFFPPYPLFSSPLSSAEELSNRIREWKKEDDWTFLKLTQEEQIIGVCLLKRYKTERPRSGLAVREAFQGRGLGFLLQTIVNEQARLLRLERLYASVAPDNIASLRIHEKCGFKKTGRMVPHYSYKNGVQEIDRQDIEMVIEF